MPVILIAAVLTANFILTKQSALFTTRASEKPFGGPILPSSNLNQAVILNSLSAKINSVKNDKDIIELTLVENSAVLCSSNPINNFKLTSANSANYFIMPTTGWNWGQLHEYNAVDIANNCGTPIYAAAEGLVIESVSNGWNEGYGNYIKIEHPNRTITVYGHLSKNIASSGKYVFQGDLIAYMGNTGNTHGPTGCHLHFEVRGAKNPLANKPLAANN